MINWSWPWGPVLCKIYCHSIKTGEDSEYSYDKLVLAMGASPVMLPMVPKGSKRITTLKTLHDAIGLRKSLERGEIKKVGIVGGGFIGCELAESFGALWVHRMRASGVLWSSVGG